MTDHSYTHTDMDGTIWRLAGCRPVSSLADEIMDAMDQVNDLRKRGVDITLEQFINMSRTLSKYGGVSMIENN